MNVSALKIGTKISIISRANVRYEGVFVEISTHNLLIALSNVRFFGTETRAADFYIAPQTRTYPYVLFKSSDIRELYVIGNPDVKDISNNFPIDTMPESYDLFRMAPFWNSSPKHAAPSDKKWEARREMLIRCNQYGRRLSPYSWRIPPVANYAGRSGDPTQLPLEFVDDVGNYEKEYDFEKYNRLFSDLCYGFGDLDLNIKDKVEDVKDDGQTVEKDSTEIPNETVSNNNDISSLVESMAIVDSVITESESSSTTLPKANNKVNASKTDSHVSAYDKSKSFFDSVSCSSIYRSGYSNPNWREWNKETFGVPMVRHQPKNSRRTLFNPNKSPEAIKFDRSFEKESSVVKANEMSPTISKTTDKKDKVTVQKIQFKAVIFKKSRGGGKGEKIMDCSMANGIGNSKLKSRAKRNIFGDIKNIKKEKPKSILKKSITN